MQRNPLILHVIEQLAPGGAAAALIETARALATAGQRHRVLSLVPPVPATAAFAAEAGLELVDDPSIADADLVWVHGWTSPVLDAFLREPHPPARWLIWLHVAGDSAPHMLTPAMASFADILVATSPYTATLPAFAKARSETRIVLAGSDLTRFAAVERMPRESLSIGYLGTLDPAKMHPDFAAMSAAAAIPHARFDIYGRGSGEKRLARAITCDARFRLHGWADNVPAALAAMDVFGYPLARNCHATAELALQEAMAAGLPSVILRHGAAMHLVEDGRTGLIARDEAEYPRALERLAADPILRLELGEAARRHALAHFGADRAALAFTAIIDWLLARPKTERIWPNRAATGAERFLAAIGPAGAPFLLSQRDDTADRAIAASAPSLAGATSGGVPHWRLSYPDDPWLAFWSGLVLRGQGKRVQALGEWRRARMLGLAIPRLDRYIAETTAELTNGSDGRLTVGE